MLKVIEEVVSPTIERPETGEELTEMPIESRRERLPRSGSAMRSLA
jgi:hypothetical protein